MGFLIGWALRFRLLVVAVAAGVAAVGVMSLRSAPVDVLPEFSPSYAEVQTEALGLSADEVEQLITVPLEADLLNGVEGIDVIRSESLPGLSSITMVFAPGTDVYRARQLVEERLTQAHALPNVSKPPTLLQPLSSSNRVLMIGLSSNQLSDIEQAVIARWTVRPRLMGVPGVANVSIWGMRDQQLQVQVDPARLRAQHVTLNQVVSSAGNAQVVSPLSFLEASTPGTGGFVETPQQRLQVRHVIEKLANPGALGKVPVEGTDGRLRLSDVADVKVDHQPLIGDAVVAGGPGLMLVVEKLPGASTIEVTEGVEDALDTLEPGLTGMRTDTSVFRPATYVEDALGNIGVALLLGGGLMLLALAAVRFRWRGLLVTAVTVPLSLLAAALVVRLLGESLNALTLAGLAAAVAVVVDGAIAPHDLVHRRIPRAGETRDARGNGAAATVDGAVCQASADSHRTLGYATVIALLPIVPVAVMAGRPGAFFSPLVLAYVLAVLSAVVVALTVAPALTSLLFWRPRWARRRAAAPRSTTPSSPGRLYNGYQSSLRRFSGRLGVPLVAAAACALVGVVMLPFLGTALLPAFHDRDVLVRLDGPPGASNPRMTEITTGVVEQLQAVPGVQSVGAHVGRAVTGDRVADVSSSDVWVAIDKDADFDATMDAINATVADLASVEHDVVAYSTLKMRDVGALTSGENSASDGDLSVLTGSDQPLAVRLFGPDADILSREADRVRQVMADVDGVVDPQVDRPVVQPVVEIEVDLDKAQRFGITPGDVRRAEATLVQGIQVGSVFDEQKVFDVIVQGVPSTRGSVEDIANLLIDRPDGGHIRLRQGAEVRVVPTESVIERDSVSRRLDIQAGISGRSTGDVVADLESRLAAMSMPLEYHAEVLDDSTSNEIGYGRVIGFAIAAAIAAFLILQAAFRSWRLAALTFIMLPLALAGGLVAALFNGAELSLGVLVGLLAVFGLATRQCMLLVDELQWRERRTAEMARSNVVLGGALDRLAPVTGSTAALVFLALPFAVLGSRPGLEVLHSTALALLGGLVTTAFVTLYVLPALYLHLAPMVDQGELRYDDDAAAGREAPVAGGNGVRTNGRVLEPQTAESGPSERRG